MRLRSRIMLVGIGLLIFALFAPTLLFYARGFRYDFDTKRIVKTGTLVIKTEPRGARVALDGLSMEDLTPTTKRFLIPGEYLVEIHKDGFLPWQKKITVHEQQVAHVPALREQLFLLPQPGSPIVISTTTQDIYLSGDNLFELISEHTLTGMSLAINRLDLSSLSRTKLKTLPHQSFSALKIVQARSLDNQDWNILAVTEEQVWYISSQDTKLVPEDLRWPSLSTGLNTILGINAKNDLVSYDLITQLETVVIPQVKNFTLVNDRIYAINFKHELLEKTFQEQEARRLASVPDFTTGRIVASRGRQVSLVLDGSLYYVADKLELINQGVSFIESLPSSNALLYGNNNELWIFDPLAKNPNQLITRTSEQILGAAYSDGLGYAFISTPNFVNAVELEWAGQSNIYTLHRPGNALSINRLFISPRADNLFILENNQMKYIKTR